MPRGPMIGAQEASLRWIYLAVIILFAAATVVFAPRNFEIVTISLQVLSISDTRAHKFGHES